MPSAYQSAANMNAVASALAATNVRRESRVTERGEAAIRKSDGGGSLRGGPMSLIGRPCG
jgi:hypothetical protein